jgi:hypothetical protein
MIWLILTYILPLGWSLWKPNQFNNQLATSPSSSNVQDSCMIHIPNSLVTNHLDDLFSVNLPRRSSTTEDIPLNRLKKRLDFFCPSPNAKAFEEYRQRVAQQKVCNSYQLTGSCTRKNSPYDHGSVSDVIIEVQRHIMIQYPCAQLGAYRSRRCFFWSPLSTRRLWVHRYTTVPIWPTFAYLESSGSPNFRLGACN